jgi:hypothetical protein
MGDFQVDRLGSSDLGRFEKKFLEDVRAFETMLDSGVIESGRRRVGCEQEMFLVDRAWRPAPIAVDLLDKLDRNFTTERGLSNLEANLECRNFESECLSRIEKDLCQQLDRVRTVASKVDAHVVLTGILPTLRKSDSSLDNLTPKPRYFALNEALCQMRGGEYEFRLKGTDGPLLASAANSPILFGRRLWQETRIPLFQQAIDTRHATASLRQRSPRVRFGEHWLAGSTVQLFREDIARFLVLLGAEIDEDALETLRTGNAPPPSSCLADSQRYDLSMESRLLWHHRRYRASSNRKSDLACRTNGTG